MKTTTSEAIKTAASARASALCDAALADLAKGRKTFVKGKPVFVPCSDDARAQRLALQVGAFKAGNLRFERDLAATVMPLVADEGVEDEAALQALLAEAADLYSTAGVLECQRRFA